MKKTININNQNPNIGINTMNMNMNDNNSMLGNITNMGIPMDLNNNSNMGNPMTMNQNMIVLSHFYEKPNTIELFNILRYIVPIYLVFAKFRYQKEIEANYKKN